MFRRFLGILILAVAAATVSCTSVKNAQPAASCENLIIYYSPDAGNEELLKAARSYGSEVLYVYKNINGIAVTVPKGRSVPDAINFYEKINGVLSVQRDRKVQLD